MTLLPPEITDRIIDFVDNNRKALYACCLVCREWVPSSRTHLFWTVDLPTRHHAALFLKFLEFTPQVGLYVRDLLVNCYGPPYHPAGLVHYLFLLKNLSKLHITSPRMSSDVLVALWSSLPCLKELFLQIREYDPGDRRLITVPNKIQSLQLVTSGPSFFEWSVHRNIFPQIRSFEHTMLGEKTEHIISLHKFLKEHCLSLVHVRLTGVSHILSEQLFDCLGSLVNLRNLFVEVDHLPITSSDEWRGWCISDIPRFLDCITSRSLMSISWGIDFDKISYMEGDVYGSLINEYLDFDIPGFTQVWEKVCRMISASRFSTVKTVGISVGTYLFDNQQRYFSPLLAFCGNGHVKLLWVNSHADKNADNYWKRMVLGTP